MEILHICREGELNATNRKPSDSNQAKTWRA